MSKLSVSITCGNPSPKSGSSVCNIDHNNRENLTSKAEKRVDWARSQKNIVFVKQELADCYEELFGAAISEMNAKKQARKTVDRHKNRQYKNGEDYLKKISDGKKEKPYYEAIIQFGDKDTCGVGSENEEAVKKMLSEYMEDFQKRNPNLKVFNAVLHLDEATPHIHLDYVPWCENRGKNGLSVKNSLTQALAQQGFSPPKSEAEKSGQLASWLSSEKEVMADILQKYGFEIDEKNEHRTHLSVDEFQKMKDEKKTFDLDKNALAEENLKLKNQLRDEEKERKKSESKLDFSEKMRRSEAVEIGVDDEEKVGAVVEKLADFNITATPTNFGVVVPNFAEPLVKKVLNDYTPKQNSEKSRDILKFDIDRFCLYASDFEGFVKLLENANYEVKRGKYFAVKPPDGERFLRTYKLGEEYSEEKIRERILRRNDFINDCKRRVSETQNLEKDLNGCLANVAILIIRNKIPPKIFNRKISYTIMNDSRICQLNDLLKLVQKEGLTRENLQEKTRGVLEKQDVLRGEIAKNIDEKNRNLKITSQLLIVKNPRDWDTKVSKIAKEKLATVGIKSFADLEERRNTSVFDERILELERKIDEQKNEYCAYLKIAEIVDDLKNGHRIWAENLAEKENTERNFDNEEKEIEE